MSYILLFFMMYFWNDDIKRQETKQQRSKKNIIEILVEKIKFEMFHENKFVEQNSKNLFINSTKSLSYNVNIVRKHCRIQFHKISKSMTWSNIYNEINVSINNRISLNLHWLKLNCKLSRLLITLIYHVHDT
jgi:hypothetical protein